MGEKEPTIAYTHKELATLLIKHADIHEGNWGVHLELSLAGGTFPIAGPDNTIALLPAGVVAVSKIGIHKYEQMNPLTVDAALVNPTGAPSGRPSKSTKKASG